MRALGHIGRRRTPHRPRGPAEAVASRDDRWALHAHESSLDAESARPYPRPVTVNEPVRSSSLEWSPAKTSISPGSITNRPLLS